MKQRNFGRVPGLLAICAVLWGLMIGNANAQDHLNVNGTVLVHKLDLKKVKAVISDESGTIMEIPLDQSGNFTLEVPANDVFTISFTSPGAVRKNLVLDTHAVKRIKKAKDRNIELVVSMTGLSPNHPESITMLADINSRGDLRYDRVQ